MRLSLLRRWLRPAHIPALIGAAILFAPGCSHLEHHGRRSLPKLRFRTNNTIAGVFQHAAPDLSMRACSSYKPVATCRT